MSASHRIHGLFSGGDPLPRPGIDESGLRARSALQIREPMPDLSDQAVELPVEEDEDTLEQPREAARRPSSRAPVSAPLTQEVTRRVFIDALGRIEEFLPEQTRRIVPESEPPPLPLL